MSDISPVNVLLIGSGNFMFSQLFIVVCLSFKITGMSEYQLYRVYISHR